MYTIALLNIALLGMTVTNAIELTPTVGCLASSTPLRETQCKNEFALGQTSSHCHRYDECTFNGWCLDPWFAFIFFDTNWDGLLDCEEFGDLLSYLAALNLIFPWFDLFVPGECWPDRCESICRLFSEIDLNGDGFIDWPEFTAWVCVRGCEGEWFCYAGAEAPPRSERVLASDKSEGLDYTKLVHRVGDL